MGPVGNVEFNPDALLDPSQVNVLPWKPSNQDFMAYYLDSVKGSKGPIQVPKGKNKNITAQQKAAQQLIQQLLASTIKNGMGAV